MHIYEAKYSTKSRNAYTDVFYSSTDKLFYVSQCITDKDEEILSVTNVELTISQIAKISEAAGRAYLEDFFNDYTVE